MYLEGGTWRDLQREYANAGKGSASPDEANRLSTKRTDRDAYRTGGVTSILAGAQCGLFVFGAGLQTQETKGGEGRRVDGPGCGEGHVF